MKVVTNLHFYLAQGVESRVPREGVVVPQLSLQVQISVVLTSPKMKASQRTSNARRKMIVCARFAISRELMRIGLRVIIARSGFIITVLVFAQTIFRKKMNNGFVILAK